MAHCTNSLHCGSRLTSSLEKAVRSSLSSFEGPHPPPPPPFTVTGAAQWQLRSRLDWRCPVAAKVPLSQSKVALPSGSYTLPGTHRPVTMSTPTATVSPRHACPPPPSAAAILPS